MTKNEQEQLIPVAHWRIVCKFIDKWEGFTADMEECLVDYKTLHEAWVKFRDLKLSGTDLTDHIWVWRQYKGRIGERILNSTITEAFDELVKGIEWYNSLKK